MSRHKINRRTFLGGGMAAAGLLGSGIFTEAIAGGEPLAETTSGKIRGIAKDRVFAFRGVPYGASTAGEGRFLPPKKPAAWAGVKDCFELGHRAPQPMPGIEPPEVIATDRMEAQGEDCLVLNLWTPAIGSGKRPVMVWLHGGGFASGSAGFAIYDGANLARKRDVVVVGVNHRLNAFGYLYLADLGGPKYAQASNVGMLDIVAALEWVRDNISRFGGDPNNVTIFGQSGGGAKVATLMAMPAAKGLFHRAIMQSGGSLRANTRENATKAAAAMLAALGLKPNQVDELQKLPMDKLVAAARGPAAFGLAPVVDGKTLPVNPFDPTAPAISANVPILTGTTETEMTFFFGGSMMPQPLDDMDNAALHERMKQFLRSSDADADKVIAVYKKVFPKISNIDVYLKATADVGIRELILTQADRKVAQGKAPAYVYYFTWRSPVREGKLKSYHTLEIPFVFENVDEAKSMTGSGQDRYALQDKISEAWVNFARTGNPSGRGVGTWPAYNTTDRPTMILDNQCKVVNDPNKEERPVLASIKRAPGGPF
jgi:para-nitrobenzyl esterase